MREWAEMLGLGALVAVAGVVYIAFILALTVGPFVVLGFAAYKVAELFAK